MNLAIGIGTLLLAGWVLPGDTPMDSDIPLPPGSKRETIDLPPQAPAGQGEGPRTRSGGGPMDSRSAAPRYGTYPQQQQQQMPREVPLPPTDPGLGGPDSPLAPPTETGSGSLPGFGTSSGGSYGAPGGGYGMPGGMMRPPSSYRGPSSASRGRSGSRYSPTATQNRNSRNDLLVMEQQAERLQPSAGIAAPAARVNKPFANYNPAPAVSPYMNLYRRDTSGGTIDNYNAFVRPMVEQGRANQTFGGEIRGLQSNVRLQNNAMQRLGKFNQRANTGTMAPEYFQNNGAFFPSFSR